MYNAQNWHISGEERSGHLTVRLSKLEASNSLKEFENTVLSWTKYDKSMHCALLDIAGEQRVFVMDAHPAKRVEERSIYTSQFIRDRARWLLAQTMAGAVVTRNSVLYDDETNGLVVFDKYKATAVVDEETGVVFMFQSGFNYVRLVTVWKGRGFGLQSDDDVVKVLKNGWMETDPANIPEVYRFKEEEKGKRHIGVIRY